MHLRCRAATTNLQPWSDSDARASRSDDVDIALVFHLHRLAAAALQLDAQPQVVRRVGETKRVFVAYYVLLADVEQPLVEEACMPSSRDWLMIFLMPCTSPSKIRSLTGGESGMISNAATFCPEFK